MIAKLIAWVKRCPTWLTLTILCTIPRFPLFGVERLWFDEAYTWTQVHLTSTFWQAVTGDDHPPFWPIIQWVNVRLFGGSEFAFRLPALVLSVGCCILIWQIALLVTGDQKVAFLAGLLTGLFPGFIYVGQDARMYAALAFWILLVVWGLLKQKPWIVFLAGLAAIYTQNVGVLYMLGLGTGAIVMSFWRTGYFWRQLPEWTRKDRDHSGFRYVWRFAVRPYIISVAWPFVAMGVLYLPWLPTLVQQAKAVSESFWMPPVTAINLTWPLWLNLFRDRLPDLLSLHLFVVAAVWLAVSLWISRKWLFRTWSGAILIFTFVSGPLLLAIYSMISAKNIYVYKPLLVSVMLLMIPGAWLLYHIRLPLRGVSRATIAIILIVCLPYYYTTHTRLDVPQWLTPITASFKSTDAIYFTEGGSRILFGHYLEPRPMMVLPYHGNVMSITDQARAAFGFATGTLDDLKAEGYKGAYWIVIRNPFTQGIEIDAIDSIMKEWAGKIFPVKVDHDAVSWTFIYYIHLD